MGQFWENLWTDGRTDGPYFIGSFRPRPGVQLEIKCMQTSRKEKSHTLPVVILVKNGCSVKHKFCTIFVPLSVAKVLEKHVRRSLYLVSAFFKENSDSHGTFTEGLFLLQLLYTKFSKRYFSELLFLVGDRKINKIYQRKLKPGDRLCGRSKLLIGNYFFTGNYFV